MKYFAVTLPQMKWVSEEIATTVIQQQAELSVCRTCKLWSSSFLTLLTCLREQWPFESDWKRFILVVLNRASAYLSAIRIYLLSSLLSVNRDLRQHCFILFLPTSLLIQVSAWEAFGFSNKVLLQ